MTAADIRIEDTAPSELEAILRLYPRAFPEEDLTGLVAALLEHSAEVRSFTAWRGEDLAGHIAFSLCAEYRDGAEHALLGPLAVDPDHQRGGMGSGLIRHGIDTLRGQGMRAVLVLGDPNYYGRFGFAAEVNVRTPHPIPPEWASAWQSIWFDKADMPETPVTLSPPAPWDDPALWA